ncbi:MAG: FIST C-terminal domain-containing protein [Microthrixaceae bacterium]|nr:FIST C-terminal domain-containing protein [Microthrixaceae bacterium]MCO5312878.1 FIST C-terminal domain-containing protein [Microthrixaceae bacterium]
MRFAAALSEHPLATQAVGEVVGQVLESLDAAPDIAMVFVSRSHGGAIEDIARVVRRLLNPRVLVGATAAGVLGGGQEIEGGAAISLWAARFGVDVEPVRLEAIPTAEHLLVAGGAALQADEGTLLLLADPFSFAMDQVIDHLRVVAPGVTMVGGMASGALGPGGNTLVLDDERFTTGAVGVWLPDTVDVRAAVSQGCRPIGEPFVVTRAERNVLYEIGGRSAVERINELVESSTDAEKRLMAAGLHIGRVIDEARLEHGRGDFLVRSVLGADRSVGAVAIDDEIPVGATVQFQVRDAASAHEDLVSRLRELHEGGVAGALAFNCTTRGRGLFDGPDHDAGLIVEMLGGAVAGMMCAGEIGPVGGRTLVHTQSVALAIFGNG